MNKPLARRGYEEGLIDLYQIYHDKWGHDYED